MHQHVDQENVVSWFYLRKLVVAVQLANERGTILGGFVSQYGNEGFDQVSAGVAKSFGSAEISRIAFHEGGIEFVFANQEAELVPQPGVTIVCTVRSARFIWSRVIIRGTLCAGRPPQLFNRTESDSVRLAQSAINSPCLCDAHFGAANEW
jgi:hypothetical protein